jgi:hypothetical protein
LLSSVCWLQSADCCLLSSDSCLASADCWLLSTVCWLMVADCYLLSTDCRLLSADWWFRTAVCWLLTGNSCLLSADCWLPVCKQQILEDDFLESHNYFDYIWSKVTALVPWVLRACSRSIGIAPPTLKIGVSNVSFNPSMHDFPKTWPKKISPDKIHPETTTNILLK